MRRIFVLAGWVGLVVMGASSVWGAFPRFEEQTIDPHIGAVCYALAVADVNGDGKTDIVAVSEDAVVWYENLTWEKHDIIRGVTERDNVCIAPHDIDGDGKIDLALGAGWRPPDTMTPSTLQWLGRDGEEAWRVHPIKTYMEPSIHRMRWGQVKPGGKTQLVVAPLQGRATKGPDWGAGAGAKVLVFDVPTDPKAPEWPVEVAERSLHTIHNVQLVDVDGDGLDEVLLAGWEGVYRLDRDADGSWSRIPLGTGNQESAPYKGASEIKRGRLADGSVYIATIEPWHGTQVVVYRESKGEAAGLWARKVVAEPLQWGHAVWVANLDDDADEELIIGQRDPNQGDGSPKGPGVFVFDPVVGADGALGFARHTIDDGGMACEDALAVDLDGDGRAEIVAGGRATHNVKIYWNRGVAR